MPSLSVCMMVQNAEKTLAIGLESVAGIYDELIIVDGGSTDSTCEIALKYGAKIIHSPWPNNYGQQRNVYLKVVKTDWIFVIDSDEFIDLKTLDYLANLKKGNITPETDNFWIPRKWISPTSKNHYITSQPHYPDWQRRLFLNQDNLYYQGIVNEQINGLQSYGKGLENLVIYHLDLFINSEEKRKEKIRRYSNSDPRDGARHFYLPVVENLSLAEINYNDLLPSVQQLIDQLPKVDQETRLSVGLTTSTLENSGLNQIIPPEIKNDEFDQAIQFFSQLPDIKTVLEIGSSSGEGSTSAFVKGLLKNPNQPTLFCLEVSQTRFRELQNRYANYDFVKCYNLSSVGRDQFPDREQITNFYQNTQTALNHYPLAEVLRWLEQDIEYVKNAGVGDRGIAKIKAENQIDYFDLVLIDGSEFTGNLEFEEIYGAKYILLDDINTFKNYQNHQKLINDRNYKLVCRNTSLRHGYAVFKKIIISSITQIPDSYQSISHFVEQVEGFMIPGQEEFLFNKVKSLPDDAVIVEIGSFKGRSTVAMGYACWGTNRKIYCIDTWDGNEEDFFERGFWEIWWDSIKANNLEKYVTPLRGFSHNILNNWQNLTNNQAIDFIFIDGSHQYIDVLKDFVLSFPFVKQGGWMAFHDVIDTWPGPEKVWHEIAKLYLINHQYSSTLACGQKIADNLPSNLLEDSPADLFSTVTMSRLEQDSAIISRNDQQIRKILFSVGVGKLASDFQRFTSPRFKEYAEYHGFEYHEITKYESIPNHPQPHWIKIDYVLKLLETLNPGDLIAWIDADVAIVRGDIQLNTSKSLAFAKDSWSVINTGVWVAKVNEFSKRFFTAVFNRTDCDNHKWQDNLAVLKVIEELSLEEIEEHIEILPNCLNVTVVKGELPQYDQHLDNPCLEAIRFRHFAGGQPWFEKYFAQPIIFDKITDDNLPIHFFTIVLNGKPFIDYHIDIFQQLPFKWHWHIVEGVADLKHDTSWSLSQGGKISDRLHNQGKSNDGTTEYLDKLAQLYPENITIYRKPNGVFWDGKREMTNEPLFNIKEECLLWQIDADELWRVQQICQVRQLFIEHPDKTAAYYWCWFFVGQNLVITTRNCYGETPQIEWLRTWRYKPGYVWFSHEPPRLVRPLSNGQWQDIASINPFLHSETEKYGLVFQHFAYVTEKQLQFKQFYYGYQNAVSEWQLLQKQTHFPVLLNQYFSWVMPRDYATVNKAESFGLKPIAKFNAEANQWYFITSDQLPKQPNNYPNITPKIIIDGVFFQLYKAGVARIWQSLLKEWVDSGFAKYILFLDREGTAPKIPGINYKLIPGYGYYQAERDREMLQAISDEEKADVFISTYYTTPQSTPSVFMAYDMLPEVMGWDLNHPMWREKYRSINQASAYLAISENTARDLVKFVPEIDLNSITIAYCGVNRNLSPATDQEINNFQAKYGISKPYFLLVSIGDGGQATIQGYKNTILFFQAFANLPTKKGFEIICTGDGKLDESIREYTTGSIVHLLQLSDQELRLAYAGAVALIYPSKYEGFGLPIIEAMACNCPVITSPNASIPEVAGNAVLYVDSNDIEGMTNALCEVEKPAVRQSLIAAGREQVQKFSWGKMAEIVSKVFIDVTLQNLNLKEINLIIFPNWSASEDELSAELGLLLESLLEHKDREKITLLIETSAITEEDANLFLAGVTMNLMMSQDVDITDELSIAIVGEMTEIQWSALLPKLSGRIPLTNENKKIIERVKAHTLPLWY